MSQTGMAGLAGATLLLALAAAGAPPLAYAKKPHVPGDVAGFMNGPKFAPGAGLAVPPAHGAKHGAIVVPAAADKAVGTRRLDHPGIGPKHDKLTRDALPAADAAADRPQVNATGKAQETTRAEAAPSAAETPASSNAAVAAQAERPLPTCR